MIRTCTLLILVVFCIGAAHAGFVPVPVTGFNKDVVANGVGPVRSSTNSSVDDARDTSGYAFLTFDYKAVAGNAAPTYALPQNGIINSANTVGVTYQLADYSGNNSLRLATMGASGTLTFNASRTASDVYVLATSGSGASTATFVVNFTDNTSQSFTATVNDWYNSTGFAIQGIGRVGLADGAVDVGGTTLNPRLYETKLTIATANYSRAIASITITKTNVTGTGFLQVMGIAINTIAPCGPPVSQPTGLVLMPTVYGINGSFTASVPPANKYMVLRSSGTSPADTPPTDGVVYSAGQTLGNATIISVSASTTFTDPGLTIGSTYTYVVLGYSDSSCAGISPAYNIVNPLVGSATIPACSATPGGTYTVGPTGTYQTLYSAMTALNNAAGAAGNIIVELQPTYSSTAETYPITIPNISSSPCAIGSPTLIIRPALGATGLVINGKVANPIIDFNAARRVKIDGRPGGVGTTSQLAIINDSTAGVAIRLTNDASNNTITYCDIQGRNISNTSGTALSGVVYFGQANTTTLNGNDYDTLSFSNIHGTVNGQPAIGISAYGTSTFKKYYNDSSTITNCNIYDFFNAGIASTGIKLDLGNNAWTINGNSLYQTASRTYTAAATHRGLWITPNVAANDSTAGNFLITNNFIGGSAANAGGATYTMAGSIANVFNGMDISVGNGIATSIQNNAIANISLTSTSISTTGVFVGIGIANGNVNVGTLVGNTIGSGTGTGSISITNGSAGTSFGIRIGGGNTVNVNGNTIGSINVTGAAAASASFNGIGTGGGVTSTVSGNTIGSLTTPNSISIAASTATTAQVLTGINMANGTNINVVNNTIANLTNNHNSAATTTASQVRGIAVSTGVVTITGNTIRSLANSSPQTSAGSSAAVLGISMTSTTAGSNVTGNKMYSLRSTNTTAVVNVVGLYVGAATTGTNTVSKNLIHSLNASTTAAGAFITGMDLGAGALFVTNNMVRVGIDSAGNSITTPLSVRGITRGGTATASKFYFNSVYVGGTGVATTTATATYAFQRNSVPGSGADSILNNVLVNARSNSGAAGGKHYAIYLNTNATNLGENFNVYQAPGTGGVFGFNGTADVPNFYSSWIGSDVNSVSGDPKFINPTGTEATVNLHISTAIPSPVEAAGLPIPGITDDYDGDVRASLTPTDIGADAGNFIAQDLSAPVVTYSPFDYTCLTTSRTFTATITDASGVPTTGSLVPRVYYRKGASGTWVSSPGTFVSGSATNGVWSFTINVAAVGGVAAGDQVYYYVIAQDVATPSNISGSPASGLVASDVNTVTTQPTNPNTYSVANGPLPGAVTITASAPAYCPTRGAVKLKATGGSINGSLISGTQATQNAATGYPAPFSNYFGGSRHQFLVLASELTAAGFAAGTPFTSLNFPVVSLGTTFTNNQNFKVKITGTTVATLSAFISNVSTTTVFGPATFTPTVGYNNLITFTTPYTWNGTDNIIIETTFSNVNTGQTTDAVIMYNSPTSFQSSIVYRADGLSAAAIETGTTISIGPNTARPDFTLKGQLAAPFTWSPNTGLFTNIAATVPYTGGQADSVYAAPATTTVYTVKATTPNGCSSSQTISVANDCTVPVTLLSFKGERKPTANLLSWTTTTELNNKGFELQRSADGINFSSLSFVASNATNGNSTSNISYSFSDTKALVGNNYYRLKQIDKDSKFEYSIIILLKSDKLNGLNISVVYPNPVKNIVNIILTSPKAAILTLIVTDVTGKNVLQQKVNAISGDNNYPLNVQLLTSGNYVIKAVCKDGCETVISRFVKE